MTERSAGELSPAELEAAYDSANGKGYGRAIATAAYKKAMRRAAEICREEKVDADATGDISDHAYNQSCDHCGAAIEREAND